MKRYVTYIVLPLVFLVCIIIICSSLHKSESITKSQTDFEARVTLDSKVAQHWLSYGRDYIHSCMVNSKELDKGGSTVHVDLYLTKIPSDFKESLEYICESIHDVYKSGVLITAYRPTPTGKDWRQIATCEWSLYTNQVKTKIF